MKHIKIIAEPYKSNEDYTDETHEFYLIISGNNVNLFPLTKGCKVLHYDSMYDFLEEWSNVSKA